MENFTNFISNPYWSQIYRNAPENVKSYYKLSWDNNENRSEKVTKQLIEKQNSFTKNDWEYLISVSSGRAKFEYTRMMNERFPEV